MSKPRLHLGPKAEEIGLTHFFTFETMRDVFIHVHRDNTIHIAAHFAGTTNLDIPCKAYPIEVSKFGDAYMTTLYKQEQGITSSYSFSFLEGDHINKVHTGAWKGRYEITGNVINIQTLTIWQRIMSTFFSMKHKPES